MLGADEAVRPRIDRMGFCLHYVLISKYFTTYNSGSESRLFQVMFVLSAKSAIFKHPRFAIPDISILKVPGQIRDGSLKKHEPNA